MELLAELTDRNVLGLEGTIDMPPRLTSRAILVNREGRIAVIYAQAFGLYSLPGGGVEKGETPGQALIREIAEETGCRPNNITELGCIYENRAHCRYTQQSFYYIVTTDGPTQAVQLTAAEARHRTSLQWHTLEDAWRLIASPVHTTHQRKFLQARDMAALTAYMKLL